MPAPRPAHSLPRIAHPSQDPISHVGVCTLCPAPLQRSGMAPRWLSRCWRRCTRRCRCAAYHVLFSLLYVVCIMSLDSRCARIGRLCMLWRLRLFSTAAQQLRGMYSLLTIRGLSSLPLLLLPSGRARLRPTWRRCCPTPYSTPTWCRRTSGARDPYTASSRCGCKLYCTYSLMWARGLLFAVVGVGASCGQVQQLWSCAAGTCMACAAACCCCWMLLLPVHPNGLCRRCVRGFQQLAAVRQAISLPLFSLDSRLTALAHVFQAFDLVSRQASLHHARMGTMRCAHLTLNTRAALRARVPRRRPRARAWLRRGW